MRCLNYPSYSCLSKTVSYLIKPAVTETVLSLELTHHFVLSTCTFLPLTLRLQDRILYWITNYLQAQNRSFRILTIYN